MKFEDTHIKRIHNDSIDPCQGCFFFDEELQDCKLQKHDTDPAGRYPCLEIDYITGTTTEYIWVEVDR